MKRYIKLSILFLFAVAICLTSGKFFSIEISNHKVETLNDSTACFSDVVTNFAYYKYDRQKECFLLYDKNDFLACRAIYTMPYGKKFIGYNNYIPLVIFLDNNDKIQQIHILPNEETPSFINKIEKNGLMQSWNGLTAAQVASINVDAISGATYSSNAIIQSVQLRMQEYAGSTTVAKSDTKNVGNIVSFVLAMCFLLFAGFCFWEPKRTTKYRVILLIASIGILGFWQGQFISITKLSSWLLNGINWQMEFFLFIVLIAAIIAPLFLGKQFYCLYVCPFGACQELIGKVNKKHKLHLSPKLVRWLKYLRYVMIVLLGALLCTNLEISTEYFEPFSAFLPQNASLSVLILASLMLVISVFINRPWCNYFCPTGAFFSLFEKKNNKAKKTNNR